MVLVKQEWNEFFSVVGSPLVVILLILITLFIVYTTIQNSSTPTATNAILTVIISLLSGLVGGVMAKRWDDINETGKLITKGRSAVRGLRYLSQTIKTLEQKIVFHTSRYSETANKDVLVETNFQELCTLCNLIQDGAIGAIEEWRDIVPEVSGFFTEIGVISELRNQKGILEDEINGMKTKLEATEEESAGERATLETKLAEKEKELKEVRSKLNQRQTILSSNSLLEIAPSTAQLTTGIAFGTGGGKTISALDLSLAPSLSLDPATIYTLPQNKTCVNCGHKFSVSFTSVLPNRCPKCGLNPDLSSISIGG